MASFRKSLAARNVLRPAVIGLALGCAPGIVQADTIRVSGNVYMDSAGGDFPDYTGPINELIYSLAGPGLPSARGEVLETIPELGTRGGLEITRSPAPPLVPGASHSLSTRATFTFGQAIEDNFFSGAGRAYHIAGDFAFIGGSAALTPGEFDVWIGRAPISFIGTLSGFDIHTGALLFRHTLHGSGTGRVTFAPHNPAFFEYAYSLDPVPEPTTVLLFGSGLGWLAMRARRARRN